MAVMAPILVAFQKKVQHDRIRVCLASSHQMIATDPIINSKSSLSNEKSNSRTLPKARVGFGEKYTTSAWHAAGRTKLVHFDSKKQKIDFSSESEDFELIIAAVTII